MKDNSMVHFLEISISELEHIKNKLENFSSYLNLGRKHKLLCYLLNTEIDFIIIESRFLKIKLDNNDASLPSKKKFEQINSHISDVKEIYNKYFQVSFKEKDD